MRAWGGVELLPLPLDQLSRQSQHPRRDVLAQASSFAWKGALQNGVLVIFLTIRCTAHVISDALTRYAQVFYMDAGQELRWSLDEIERRLRLAGNFHVAQEGWTSNCTCCGNSFVFTHTGTLQALGIPAALIYGRPMSAGGIQVWRANCISFHFIQFMRARAGVRERKRCHSLRARRGEQVQPRRGLPVP